MSQGKGYRKDLATIHDVGFGGFSRQATPGLLTILHQNGISSGLVVDLGCGSGIWARELIRAGYDVLGIDISPAMIKLARMKAPEATFMTGSFLRANLPLCDAVTSLGECLNYSFDRNISREQLVPFFSRVHAALRPGGVFIFDIAGPGSNPRKNHREGKDWAILFETEEDPKRETLIRRITTFRRVGRFYRRSEEVHRLRLYRGSEIAKELRRAGFRVRLLRGYGTLRFPDTHTGLLARKGR